MSASRRLPMSTRVWVLVVCAGLVFVAWALLWPAPAAPVEAASTETPPEYPAMTGVQMAAPNAADPAWSRPLFFNDRAPRVASLGGDAEMGGEGSNAFMATLTGIVRSPVVYLATLSPGQGGKPLRVRLGDEVEGHPGWKLIALGARSATFRNGEQEQVLRLVARNALNAPAAGMPSESPSTNAPPPPPPPALGVTGQVAAPAAPAASTEAEVTPEQRKQVEAIRERIQARRKQLLQQPPSPAPSPKPH